MVDNVITKRWLWLIFVYPEITKTKINNKINIQWNTILMTTYAVCQKSYHCMRLFWMIPFDMYSTNTFIFIEMYKINYLRYMQNVYILEMIPIRIVQSSFTLKWRLMHFSFIVQRLPLMDSSYSFFTSFCNWLATTFLKTYDKIQSMKLITKTQFATFSRKNDLKFNWMHLLFLSQTNDHWK